MTSSEQTYHNLSLIHFNALAGHPQPISLAVAMSASGEALKLVDAQIASLDKVTIPGSFPGSSEMSTAVQNVQNAAKPWPSIKSAITAAAQHAIKSVSKLDPIGSAAGIRDALTPAQIKTLLENFKTNDLQPIQAEFAAAKTGFDSFNTALDNAYSNSASANSTATAALTKKEQAVHNKSKSIQAEIDSLSSVGGVLAGIFTGGIYDAVKAAQLNGELKDLRNQTNDLAQQQRLYDAAYAAFGTAMHATKTASQALDTVGTALNETKNALDDVINATSDNPIVVQALANTFVKEYSKAAQQARSLTS